MTNTPDPGSICSWAAMSNESNRLFTSRVLAGLLGLFMLTGAGLIAYDRLVEHTIEPFWWGHVLVGALIASVFIAHAFGLKGPHNWRSREKD